MSDPLDDMIIARLLMTSDNPTIKSLWEQVKIVIEITHPDRKPKYPAFSLLGVPMPILICSVDNPLGIIFGNLMNIHLTNSVEGGISLDIQCEES